MKKLFLVIVFIIVIGLTIIFTQPQTVQLPKPNPYNILWLTGESTRPDHLQVYGYDKATSPNIDAFAKTAVRFDQAYNPSGWTSENMVSNLVGVNSITHQVHVRNKSVPSGWYTPIEMLKDVGYTTARIQSFQKIPNYDFLGLDDDGHPDDLLAWLTKHKDGPFFIWYHLLQSHLPYDSPQQHKDLFWSDDMITSKEQGERVDVVTKSSMVILGEAEFKPEDQGPIHALYDGGIHYMDAEFGKVIQKLKELGLEKNTIVIYSADHGEELLDHGFVGHASTAKGGHLHEEITRVPLMISFPPELKQGRVIIQTVRGLDIMPTIFDLLGLPHMPWFDGESLVPMMQRPKSQPARIAYASSSYKGYQEDDPENVVNFMRAVRKGDWKLFYRLWDLSREEFYLYQLSTDPGSLIDVKEQYPDKLVEMKKVMYEWVQRSESNQLPPEPLRESQWTKLTRYLDELFTSDEVVALIAKAPSPPKITAPQNGEVITFAESQGNIRLVWDGLQGVPYLIDITAGVGENKIDVQFKTSEPWLEQQVTEAYWKEYLLLYRPVKYRVKINRSKQPWSEWRTFELK